VLEIVSFIIEATINMNINGFAMFTGWKMAEFQKICFIASLGKESEIRASSA